MLREAPDPKPRALCVCQDVRVACGRDGQLLADVRKHVVALEAEVESDEERSEHGWVDTNALRRVGVELDDNWGHEQAGNDISTENIRQCTGGGGGALVRRRSGDDSRCHHPPDTPHPPPPNNHANLNVTNRLYF